MRFSTTLCHAALAMGCTLSLSAQTAPAPATPAKHGMTLDDLAKIERVGDPQVSPDGMWVAYTVGKTDVAEDKGSGQLWMVSWDGKQDIQLTSARTV